MSVGGDWSVSDDGRGDAIGDDVERALMECQDCGKICTGDEVRLDEVCDLWRCPECGSGDMAYLGQA